MPDVSVLIPAYKAHETIRACVLSVLAGAAAVEVLVESDDGSDYSCVSDLAEVAVTGKVGSGVGAARNRALARARCPWVAYVDADDRVAPGYFADLLRVAKGAAAAPTEVWRGAERIGRVAPPVLDFAAMGREGASFRGIVRREACPDFAEDLSQDILHMAEVVLTHGPLAVGTQPYHLQLGAFSVTAATDFSTRVEAAYQRHIATLKARHAGHPRLSQAVGLFDAKTALNRRFVAEGGGLGYYDWVLQRERCAAAAG